MWKYRKRLNDFMTAVSDYASTGEIWVYGDIVDNGWWNDMTSPVMIRDSLYEMGPVATLNVRITSYGGSIPAGNCIIDIIDDYRRETKAKIIAYIEGIAASMASGIPMVADKIYMAANSLFVVHKPFTIVSGNSNDLESTIEALEKAEETLISNYMRHFKGTEDELRDMLAKETWFTAKEAMEWGFCDEIIPSVPVAASINGGILINRQEFRKNAEKIVAMFPLGTPLASLSDQEEKEEENNMYVQEIRAYDKELAKYGITEDVFAGFDVSAETVQSIAAVVATNVQPFQTDTETFMTADMVKDALGEEMDSGRVLALAKAGMEYDESDKTKAKAYEKLLNAAIENTLKSGVRAKGENFNDTKWKKILSNLDYDEILDQGREWDEEAKVALHAGFRASQPWKQESKNNHGLNLNDYNFAK